jgi:hypothetical protein
MSEYFFFTFFNKIQATFLIDFDLYYSRPVFLNKFFSFNKQSKI